MATDTSCVVQRQHKLSTGERDDWNDFNGFEGTQVLCDNLCEEGVLDSHESPSNLPLNSLDDAIERCFSQSPANSSENSVSRESKTASDSQEEVVRNSRLWQDAINNVCNVLPTNWSTTHACKLMHKALNISDVKQAETTSDLDLSEDEELQQAFDMHSLIISNVHEEPLFTAEQVIKEIEEMLEDSGEECDPIHDDSYSEELAKLRERSRSRIEIARQSIEKMSSQSLCELYDEMDSLVRELSEELVLELARRDELGYEKELKNQFISLLLSVQQRHRALVDSKTRPTSTTTITSKSSNQTSSTGNTQPGCYLTTLIPYDPRTIPPSIEYLQIYVKILKAINEDSPTVPTLLTDYILKVICPKV